MHIEMQTNGTCKIEGKEYPAVGLGTYPFKGEECTHSVSLAAQIGYRIIDTATYYDNFEAISQALQSFDRRDFYLISKVFPESQTPEGLRKDLQSTLKRLNTSYLDAYLLHWPNHKIPIEQTLHTMNELSAEGLIRHIGLSNVTVNHLKRALEVNVPISWVQVEMHPVFYDAELLNFCKKHSIIVQAWRPLNLGQTREDKLLSKIGKKHGKTACQVALRWILQHGCMPLPGSKNEAHLRQNLGVLDFKLSKDEMMEIDQRALTGTRFRLTLEYGVGFADEFDFAYEECWPK